MLKSYGIQNVSCFNESGGMTRTLAHSGCECQGDVRVHPQARRRGGGKVEERWRKGGGKEEKKKREGKRKARATAEPWRFYTSGFVASLNAFYVYFCSTVRTPATRGCLRHTVCLLNGEFSRDLGSQKRDRTSCKAPWRMTANRNNTLCFSDDKQSHQEVDLALA